MVIFRKNIKILILGLISIPFCCHAVIDEEEYEESKEAISVRSYQGNYVVIAPDTETAAFYAKLAEDTRKQAAKVVNNNKNYNIVTYIKIHPKPYSKTDWIMSALHSILKRDFGTMPKSRLEGSIKYCVVYYYLLDSAAAEAIKNDSTISENQMPLWICAAVMENLTQESREAYRNFVSSAISEGKCLSLEKLFIHNGDFKNEQERALYSHQCGSLFDYLASLESGRKRVFEALEQLYKGGDLSILILRQFEDEFTSVVDMETKWSEFVKKRSERYFDFVRFTKEETQGRLSDLLIVEIKYLDGKTIQEKAEKTDLEGLMNYKDKTVRINIALNKIARFQDLKLRASKEYQGVLDEYLLALKAIAEQEKAKFKKHYKKANELFVKSKQN